MKAGYTHISLLLDRSGSMTSIANDVIGGFNTFLQEQKDAPGKATFTMAQFDNNFDYLYKFADIHNVVPLTIGTFNPRGGTALNDSLCKLIDETGQELAILPDNEKPAGVLFVIITDGQENMSWKYKSGDVKQRIEHQEAVYNWSFTYIGANVDAFAESSQLGIKEFMSFTADSAGVDNMYRSLSKKSTSYRAAH